MLRDLGRVEAARTAFAHAIAQAPDKRADYTYNLSSCGRFRPGDPHFAAIEAMAENPSALPIDARILMHFTLGKGYADLGRHDESARHYLAGNALKRGLVDYQESEMLAVMEGIRDVFTPARMAETAGLGHPSDVPVFIVGMPRSSSTLVEQILASHHAVVGAGEITDFVDPLMQSGADGAPPPLYPQMARTLSGDDLRRLGGAYVRRLLGRADAAAKPGVARIVNKTLINFLFVGLIHQALPRARVIHTVRDPVDTCFSCFTKLFGANIPFTYDLAELGRYYRAYADLMAHWRAVVPPDVLLTVRYEDLVTDLEGQARRIVAHCGLGWDAACLTFERTARTVRTASTVQVREPIFTSSIGRAGPYEAMLAPLRGALGDLRLSGGR